MNPNTNNYLSHYQHPGTKTKIYERLITMDKLMLKQLQILKKLPNNFTKNYK